MSFQPQLAYLIASADAEWIATLTPALRDSGARIDTVATPDAALAALTSPRRPSLALLDACLPGIDMGCLLAAIRADAAGQPFPVVLFANTLTLDWEDRLIEGVIDDLLPRSLDPAWIGLRLNAVLRAHERTRELDTLRNSAAHNDLFDGLTGAYTRNALLAQLFRETDRVQRMNNPLCVILFDIDDFGHWNSRLGADVCDELLVSVTGRMGKLLRSYDLLGRVGKDEFLAALPGCSPVNAVLLAERIRTEVFGSPFHAAGHTVRLSACFGVAPSQGRSPIVVLRDAEEALRIARNTGPESIHCSGDCPDAQSAPVAFLSGAAADDQLGW